MKSKQARLKEKRKQKKRIQAKKAKYVAGTVTGIWNGYLRSLSQQLANKQPTLVERLKGDYMTVCCPDCGTELKIPMASRSRSGHVEKKPIGNEASVLQAHRGKMPCEARQNANEAKARGLIQISNMEGETFVPLQETGLVESLRTLYDPGGRQGGQVRASSHIETEFWAPVWAVQVARDALAAGDEPVEALTTYWAAVREMPEDQVAQSMLGDSRLLGQEESAVEPIDDPAEEGDY